MNAPDTAAGRDERGTLLSRLIRPADDWADAEGGRSPRTLESLMTVLMGSLAANAVVAGAHALGVIGTALALILVLGLVTASSLLVLLLWYQIKRHLHEPLAQLHGWALGMCDGDLSTRIPSEQAGRFKQLVFHINRLSEALEHLANEMDETVWSQTERLRLKNQSLETLYEVAAAINSADHIDDVLGNAARTLMKVVDANGATVRLRGESGALEVLLRIGEAPQPADEASDPGAGVEVRCARSSGTGAAAGLVMIPLTHKSEQLGVITLHTGLSGEADDPEKHKLLQSIGRHLGMAIAKARVDIESKQFSIMHERAAIAHELHDSLAQTLLSLRYQTDTLADSVRSGAGDQARREVERIRNTLGEANTELRELIANFRAPVAGRTLLDGLADLVERFRRESPFAIYLQVDGQLPELTEGANLQIVRIVGEALANAQRHSRAKTVRVLVHCCREGNYEVLVEDDGVGMTTGDRDEHLGEHIGLAVMSERARWLGGSLSVESEPGEGTRVQLSFRAAGRRVPGAAVGAS
jgi:two-component system nitrate/nitrite sensor histidine kinase NarX